MQLTQTYLVMFRNSEHVCMDLYSHIHTKLFHIPGFLLGRCMCESKYQILHLFFQQAPKYSVLSLFFGKQNFLGSVCEIFKSACVETDMQNPVVCIHMQITQKKTDFLRGYEHVWMGISDLRIAQSLCYACTLTCLFLIFALWIVGVREGGKPYLHMQETPEFSRIWFKQLHVFK